MDARVAGEAAQERGGRPGAAARERGAREAGDAALTRHVQAELDAAIRPLVHMHGGDVTVDRVAEGVVTLQMHGACRRCLFRTSTYAQLLRHHLGAIPGVRDVVVEGLRLSAHALRRLDALAARRTQLGAGPAWGSLPIAPPEWTGPAGEPGGPTPDDDPGSDGSCDS